MKRIISAILVCVLLVCSMFALTSCDKVILGKYKVDLVLYEETYEFGLFGKVTKTQEYISGNDTVTEGTYQFNEAGDKIILTFNDDPQTYDFSSGTEDGIDYIKLNGVPYEKID